VININTLHRLGISEQTIEPTFYQARAANSGLMDLVGQITIPILFSNSIATVTGLNYEWTDILRDPEFEFRGRNSEQEDFKRFRKFIPPGQKNIDDVEVCGDIFKVTFLVARDLSMDAILGMKAMTNMGMLLDTRNKVIILGNRVYDYAGKKPHLRTAQEVTILKGRAKRVELNAIGIPDGTIGVQDTIPIRGIMMEYSEALTTVKDGRGFITIGNLTDEPITINQNCEVVEVVENFEEELKDAGRIRFGEKLSVTKRKKLVRLIHKHLVMFQNKLRKNLHANRVYHSIRVRKEPSSPKTGTFLSSRKTEGYYGNGKGFIRT
jgi:hypothetical protein